MREKAAAAEHQAELVAVRSDIKARVMAMAAEVGGWGVYCYDFLLLPITSYYS